MKRKAAATKRRDAARCFAVCAASDKSTTACRYKRKNGDSWVAVGQTDYVRASCVGTLAVDKGLRVEVWQTGAFGPTTPVEKVVNVPLLPTQLLVYPLVLRAQCDADATVPTVGRLRRMLCEYMKTQAQLASQVEEEDEALDSINDTTTIGSIGTEEDDEDAPSDSEQSGNETPTDSEDDMDVCENDETDAESGTEDEDIEDDAIDEEELAFRAAESKRRRVGIK
jgi:hypothetical protein